jgi:hypothetical protein
VLSAEVIPAGPGRSRRREAAWLGLQAGEAHPTRGRRVVRGAGLPLRNGGLVLCNLGVYYTLLSDA